MKRRLASVGFALLASFVCLALIRTLFNPSLQSRQSRIEALRLKQAEGEAILARKNQYDSQWKNVQGSLREGGSPEEALNRWVKEILSYGESQGLVFAKVEPGGVVAQGKEKKEIRLYLLFEGDLRRLVSLIYHLLEKDPLSKVESFVLQRKDGSAQPAYELTLGKVLL